MLASEIWARVLVCESPNLQDSATLWAPWPLQWIVFSLSFWVHGKQVVWVKCKSFPYVKPVSAWGCWLLQHNLPYTEARHSSADLGLDVCNVLCSTLILLFLNPSRGENSDSEHQGNVMAGGTQRKETQGRLFQKHWHKNLDTSFRMSDPQQSPLLPAPMLSSSKTSDF